MSPRAAGQTVDPVWSILDELRGHSSRKERRAAARIAALRREIFPELVDALRHHPNPWARGVAASSLVRFGDQARRALLRALRDPAMPVRLHALLAVDRVWAPSATPAIIRLLDDPSGGVRVNVITVLVRRRAHGASRAIMRRVADPKWYVRQQAARALGTLGTPQARGSLRQAMGDPRRAVREAAAQALARIERRRVRAGTPRRRSGRERLSR